MVLDTEESKDLGAPKEFHPTKTPWGFVFTDFLHLSSEFHLKKKHKTQNEIDFKKLKECRFSLGLFFMCEENFQVFFFGVQKLSTPKKCRESKMHSDVPGI